MGRGIRERRRRRGPGRPAPSRGEVPERGAGPRRAAEPSAGGEPLKEALASVKATVFLPTLNGGAAFRRVLDALARQDAGFAYEVLVIDSGSRDGTDRAAAEAGARVIAIPPEEFNHGRTRNRGIAEARGEFVALLTQDAEPADAHWLARLVEALEAVPDAAGAYCRQIPRPDCDPFVRDRLARWAATRTTRDVQAIPDPEGFWALPPLERLARIAFDNVASCVRRSVMRDHPFPERPFGEDVAWSLEVMLAGGKIVYEPAAAVVHSHREGLWASFRRVYRDHRNLNDLLGISLVPGFGDLLKNCWRGFGYYGGVVARSEGLTRWQRLGWRLYGGPYGALQVLAQYLGPRSNRWRRSSRLARGLDRLIMGRG
jgi:rhamnosyltransferase